jgi:hypothetical protein
VTPKQLKKLQRELGLEYKEYIERIPRKIPEGKVLVHNHIRLQRPIGRNGSRMWIQDLNDSIAFCPCGRAWWRADLPHCVPSWTLDEEPLHPTKRSDGVNVAP